MSPDGPASPAARPAPRRIGLLWTLLGVLLLTSLAPLGLTAFKLIDINRESLESASREYQLQVATAIVRELDAAVSGARIQLAAMGHYLESEIRRLPGQTIVHDEGRLAPYLSGDLLLLRYTSKEGSVLEVGDRTVSRQETVEGSLFEAFATSVGGEAYVGRPVAAAPEGGPPRVVAAVPVRARGQVRGVLAGVVDLGPAWQRSVATLGSHYITFALDDAGALFAQAGLPDALREGEGWRRMEIVTRFASQGAGVTEIIPFEAPPGLKTKELLGARSSTDRGWGIFVLVDRGLAYASVAEMRRSVTQWALFAVLLAGAAAVVSAGAVTRPLKVLVDRTRRIAAGDFATRAEVRSRNELGELAQTFNAMAEEISNYIERIKRAAEENNQLFLGTIRALAAAIDEKDPYTRGHSERVNRYAVAIARQLGLSRQDLRSVTVGALLHDVGKIGIEDAILRKPAALSDKEFEVMKRHPLKGAHILEEIPGMKEIIPAMRNHHERWAGGGYPDNLKGDEIPLLARIVQVADTFDAMTTNRPYQRAMKTEAAVARVAELSGIVFDPRVVSAFKAAWAAGDLKIESSEARQAPSAAT